MSMFEGGQPEVDWMCNDWWLFLARLVQFREHEHSSPFSIIWTPPMVFEVVLTEFLADELVAPGICREHSP